MNIEDSNPLLLQTVTLELFKAKLKEWFPSKLPQYTHLDADITEDEKNVKMYACGYVPVVLIHQYDKRAGSKYTSFVQCLLHNNMITVHF